MIKRRTRTSIFEGTRRLRRPLLSGNQAAIATLIAAASIGAGVPVNAQDVLASLPPKTAKATPVEQQASEVSDELQPLTQTTIYRPDPYIVRGIQPFSGKLLATQTLIFEANSALVLAPKDLSDTVTIVADVIDVRGSGARITWRRPDAPSEIPPGRGQAPAGLIGRGAAENGGKGLDGDQGNIGLSGKPALNVIIAFKEWNNKDLSIDLRGSAGGPGGPGQDGGSGGQGGQGAAARSGFIDCSSGPGQGGKGGDGGSGGRGGAGGVGGTGGTVMLISAATKDALGDVRVFVVGGDGGVGGAPGGPGIGGVGGREGETAGLCRPAGRNGIAGAGGALGVPGPTGQPGPAGAFVVVPVSQATSDRVFRPQ